MSRHPDAVDSPVGAATRFAVELVAWVTAPWAAAMWSWVLAAVLLVALVALPSVFNIPGDKHHVGRAVSGVTRIVIEAMLFGAAMAGVVHVWPLWAALLVGCLMVVAVVAGLPRWRWLLRQDQAATNSRLHS